MYRVIAFARGEKAGDICSLLKIDPQSAHRIMNAGENSHRHVSRVVTDEHLVDLKDRTEPFGERFGRYMRQVKVDLILACNAVALKANLKDLTRRDIARHE